MAASHRVVVVMSLVMFACIIGLSSCASNSNPDVANHSKIIETEDPIPDPDTPRPPEGDYDEDDSEFLVGTRPGDAPSPSNVIAAPIGGPVPPGVFQPSPPATGAKDSSKPSSAAPLFNSLSLLTGTTAAIAGFFYL